jgi:hypothetical protein
MDKAVVCYDSVLPKRPFYAHSTAPPRHSRRQRLAVALFQCRTGQNSALSIGQPALENALQSLEPRLPVLVTQWSSRRNLRLVGGRVEVICNRELVPGAFRNQYSKGRLTGAAHTHEHDCERPRHRGIPV